MDVSTHCLNLFDEGLDGNIQGAERRLVPTSGDELYWTSCTLHASFGHAVLARGGACATTHPGALGCEQAEADDLANA